jgi:catechol 2,3-dioxygenase-like lactoylglutathione lyase family enzyme
MTNKITHFGIVVNDADAACDLWCASFGMKKAGDMLIAEEGIRSVFTVADSAKILEARKMRVIHRDAVGGGDVGRWLVHPKDANGVMVEGIGGLGNNPAR